MELPKYFYFRLHPAEKGTAVEIDDASDVDVVEVVRCKDCKAYDSHDKRCKVWNHGVAEHEYCYRGLKE